MRKFIVVAAVVLSASIAEAAQGRLTDADAAAVDAIEHQLTDASKDLLSIQRGTPVGSLSFACYADASQATSDLEGSVGQLGVAVSVASLMGHQDDAAIAEKYVALAANQVIGIAGLAEKWVSGLEGTCSQDSLAISKLNSLLELIGRANQTAEAINARLTSTQ
jgi:hypothetical protein